MMYRSRLSAVLAALVYGDNSTFLLSKDWGHGEERKRVMYTYMAGVLFRWNRRGGGLGAV